MTNSPALLLVLTCVLFTCCSAQSSCQGRCGEAYDRGHKCHCDYECLVHKECCKNYASLCTTGDSCKGRCGEHFMRGRQCHCDIECLKYKQCCPDYETQCTLEDTALKPENTASSAQRTASLCQNTLSNKTTESSMEEDAKEPEYTTYDEDLQDPEGEDPLIIDAPPDTASENEPMSEVPVEGMADNVLTATPPLPNQLDEVQPSQTVKQISEIEEDNLPLHEPQSTTVPTTTISSFSSAASQTLTETSDINGPPTADETESPEDDSQPEQPQPPSDQPTVPREVNETVGPDSKLESEQPDKSEADQSIPESKDTSATMAEPEIPYPTVPAKDKPVLEDDNEPQEESGQSEVIEPTTLNGLVADPTDKPSIAETTMADLDEPSSTVLPEDTKAPEKDTKAQEENGQLGVRDSTAVDGMENVNSDPTDKPSTAEMTTNTQNELIPPTAPSITTALPENKPQSQKLNPSPATAQEKPTKPKEEIDNILDEGKPWDYQADANNDTNLCSGRPVNGLTMLKNGTLVVFRGHFFWTLDSRRYPGPAQAITDVWGIPSPIDTVYTRCNCQGKTYFFKGNNYWRFENDNMDSGFPKPISDGFEIRGNIIAALSMPKYRSRKESVFFFKRGGLAQRYTYNVVPQCGRKRYRRAAGSTLGPEINMAKNWYGFPSTVTSAVSVPSTGGDGYKYYVFSQTKYYSLKMEGETPVILTPKVGPGKQKSAKSWFRCPENQRARTTVSLQK